MGIILSIALFAFGATRTQLGLRHLWGILALAAVLTAFALAMAYTPSMQVIRPMPALWSIEFFQGMGATFAIKVGTYGALMLLGFGAGQLFRRFRKPVTGTPESS